MNDEATAKRRFMMLNLLRFASIGLVMLGIAITYDAVSLPKALGIPFAFGGMAGFFFGPKFLVRNWKTPEDANGDGAE
ncbi:MAG: hypothetical protein ABJP34_11905 [Erythrobacter sp.]